MAEIFGAVASGAGLVSLSMQLLESTQKLKGFCDLVKDAPEMVRQLCFDLETMAMALRQFEQYRQIDVSGSELLGRCIVACDQAVAKVRTAVDKIERLLSRARFAGRLYMGFKEPEVRKLVEEMEHAKSSMLLAYTSYCQSWSVRESAKHAAALTLQAQRLDILQTSVESGNLALLGHITTFASQQVTSSGSNPPQQAHEDRSVMGRRKLPKRPRSGTEYKFRLALPHRLVKCIWEFSLHECDNAWTFQLSPVNIRSARTYAFDFVRAGDVGAVRELMRSRQLSIQDREPSSRGSRTLLEMAARNGHLELCRFLLQETSHPADNAVLSSALKRVLKHAWFHSVRRGTDDPLLEDFYRLLVSQHNLDIDLLQPPSTMTDTWQMTHTKNTFGVVLANQPTPFVDLSLAQKFTAAVEAVGWPVDAFATMLHRHNPIEVVTRANEEGKTALHWAAAHLGQWLRWTSVNRHHSRNIKSYAKLASDLVRVGADVHALWHEKTGSFYGMPSLRPHDPFLSLLKGIFLRTTAPWNRSSLAEAVNRWGEVLVAGGVHLDDYVVTENQFLCSIEWPELDIPSWDIHGSLVPVKLSITKESTLAAEMLAISCVTIWKAQVTHIPGAWPTSPLFIDTVIWEPGATDECDGFYWVPSDMIHVKPGHNQVDALNMTGGSDELLHDSITDAKPGHRESHDDHGPVAIVLGQEIRSRERVSWRHSSGPRASSAPTLQGHKATLGANWTNRAVYMPSGWRFALHKCPLDLRWHKRSLWLSFSDFRRDCMQGRCHEVRFSDEEDYGATFEWWFLRSEEHVHAAKRFAQKFCPEQMHVVDATLARVTDRARLAMGPKRPEDAGMP